ncbi:MAG: glycoside hydrolase family 31 protein [Clostridia bacterium]|nr:glycoside hydrolase family 31 protein [Clostridia bacterium]
MKMKPMKRWFTVLMAILTVLPMLLSASLPVIAETTSETVEFNVTPYKGMVKSVGSPEIRLTSPGGIRFVNKVDVEKYHALMSMMRDGTVITDLSLGTLIAPAAYVEQAGDFTVEALDKLPHGVNYVKVEAKLNRWYNSDDDEDGYYEFAGSLTNIKLGHGAKNFMGVGYVELTMKDGSTVYIYGDYSRSGASISSLADAKLENTAGLTKGQIQFLGTYKVTPISYSVLSMDNVYQIGNRLYFTVGDTSAYLSYTGDNGWRIKAHHETRIGAEQMGAAQAMAYYLEEESTDRELPITVSKPDNSTLRVTTADGTYVDIGARVFAMYFYSTTGRLVAQVSGIEADGTNVNVRGVLTDTEGVYGGGERLDTVNKRGTTLDLYTCDGWNNSATSYVAIPLFTTTRGAGIYINRYERIVADFADTLDNVWSVKLENEIMDFYIFANDDIKDSIENYTKLSGAASVPEEWAYGVMLCRYSSDLTTFENDKLDENGNPVLNKDNAPSGRSVKTLVNKMIEAGMKPTSVIMEAWSYANFNADKKEELRQTCEWLDSLGIKAMLYMRVASTISSGMPGYNKNYLLNAWVTTNGETAYTTKIPDVAYNGQNPDAGKVGGTHTYLDITNPEAMEWYLDVVWGELLKIGVDGVKIDFCETFPDEYKSYGVGDNTTVVKYDWHDPSKIVSGSEHHAYPTYFITAFYNRMNELKKQWGMDDGFFVLTRGGGIGSQRNPYMWAGDQARNFDKLDDQIMAVINSGLSGIPFMSYDMAGYRYGGGGTSYGSANSLEYESGVFARAIAFTVFMPNIQTHGTVRNAYELLPEAQTIYKNFLAFREELMPYLNKLVEEACTTGLPISRHPVLHYQDDPKVYDLKTQFMFGDGLMIAPILNADDTTVNIYLPEGSWTNLLTGKVITVGASGKTLTVDVNYGQIAVFLNNDSADAQMLNEIFASDAWSAIKNYEQEYQN